MRSKSLISSLVKLMVLLLLVLDSMVLSVTARNNRHVKREWYLATREMQCNEPQNRSYYVTDFLENILNNFENKSEYMALLPTNIILKRCDEYSGCCGSKDLSCSPVEISYIEKEILVINVKSNCSETELISVEQHKKCDCVDMTAAVRHERRQQQPNVTLVNKFDPTKYYKKNCIQY